MSKILVVDDSPTNRQFLMILLDHDGHELLEAPDGAVALDLARTHKPDLVITDILMPVMDGFEFTRRMRADPALSGTSVIFYTATYRAPQARALAAACGVRSVLPKPCEPEVLLETVRIELGLSAPPSGGVMMSKVPTPKNPEAALDHQLSAYVAELLAVKEQLDKLATKMTGLADVGSSMAETTTRLSDNLRHLQRFGLRMATIIDSTLDVLPEQDAERIVARFFDSACALIVSHYAVIALHPYHKTDVHHVFAKGLDAAIYKKPCNGDTLVGKMLKERGVAQLRFQSDRGNIEGFPQSHPPVRSFLAVAIESRGRTHGWMYFAEPYGKEQFTDEDERIAASLALHIALFYDNAIIQDLMQNRAAELQIELAARERAPANRNGGAPAGTDLGAAAHDFNNVLTIFKGVTEDLQADYPKDAIIAEHVDIMTQALKRGSDLIAKLRGGGKNP